MKQIAKFFLVAAGLIFTATQLYSANSSAEEKKDLTLEQILTSIPEGIVNPLPRVGEWIDKNNVKLYKQEDRKFKAYSYNVKTGDMTALEADESAKRLGLVSKELLDFYKTEQGKKATNPTLSPDKSKIAYTDANNNLCVYNISDSLVKQLTTDGTNLIMNGYASWVYYEEILGRPSRYKAFWWSPDSKTLAYYWFDDTQVPYFPIYDSKGQYGSITETHYPKAGDKNPEVKVGFVNIESGNTVWADFNKEDDQYFGIPFWNADGTRFIIPWMPREQNNLILYTVNPADGSKTQIYNETQKTWIDWMEDMQFTSEGFYMVRDFDMWEQIYFQSFDGTRLEKITDGKNWGIKFVKVDLKEGAIYFTARREVSTRNDFYKVDLKTKKITRLSVGEYNYSQVVLSPDNKNFVAVYSNTVTPTQVAVISIGKKPVVKVIADSKGENFDKYNLAIGKMLSITTDEGYVLPAQIIYPVDMDSTKRYPVLVSMYGGPNAGTVMDTWKGINEKTQWWANQGVIQISIDHRASGHCGKEGLNYMHRNLLTIELEDYIDWMKYLRTKPYVNKDKVGITGFSYGGSMTMLACTVGNEYFKYGIAGGGVYDYRLYDTHYTERYMDTPQTNPDGYANTVMADKVKYYKGDSTNYVKITHGAADDNVHMQNTLHLINALQDSGKQFDLMIYPGEYHGYRGKKSVHSTIGDYIFWYRHLLETNAPAILIDKKMPR